MQKWKSKFQKEYWVAFGLFFLAAVVTFFPWLTSGEMLLAHDQIQGYGGWTYHKQQWLQGIIPLWSDGFLAGMPAYEGLPGDSIYPPFLITLFLFSAKYWHGILFFTHTVLAGLLAYHFLRRRIGLESLYAMVLSLCYMLNTNFFSHIHPGHTGKFYVLSWLPLGLSGLFGLLQTGKWVHVATLGGFIGIGMFTSHVQYVYFVLMGFFVYMTTPLVIQIIKKEKPIATVGATYGKFWIAVFLGLGVGSPVLLPALGYTQDYSIRGTNEYESYQHAISWSAHPEEIASLVVHEFTGHLQNYWGRNVFKLNSEYPGLVILVLGILGLILFRRRRLWIAFAVLMLSIIYALADHTPFFKLFYHTIPGVKNFRAASMILFWAATSLFLMSAWSLLDLLKGGRLPGDPELIAKRLFIASGVCGLIALVGFFAAESIYSLWNGVFSEVQESRRFPAQKANVDALAGGMLRTFFLMATLLAAVGLFLKGQLERKRLAYLLLAVASIDLLIANLRFVQTFDSDRAFQINPLFQELAERDTTNFRTFELPSPNPQHRWQNGFTGLYGFKSVNGFYDNEIRWYRKMHGPGFSNFTRGLQMQSFPSNDNGTYVPGKIAGSNLLDLLNVKYVLAKDQSGRELYLENTSKLPYAFWQGNLKPMSDEEAFEYVLSPRFDPKREIVVLEEERNQWESVRTESSSEGVVAAEAIYGNSRIEIEVDAPAAGIVFVSEIFYPIWKAKLDGEPVDMVRVNYAFRGIPVSQGKHTIVMTYNPTKFTYSWFLTFASLGVIGVILFVVTPKERNSQDRELAAVA